MSDLDLLTKMRVIEQDLIAIQGDMTYRGAPMLAFVSVLTEAADRIEELERDNLELWELKTAISTLFSHATQGKDNE